VGTKTADGNMYCTGYALYDQSGSKVAYLNIGDAIGLPINLYIIVHNPETGEEEYSKIDIPTRELPEPSRTPNYPVQGHPDEALLAELDTHLP